MASFEIQPLVNSIIQIPTQYFDTENKVRMGLNQNGDIVSNDHIDPKKLMRLPIQQTNPRYFKSIKETDSPGIKNQYDKELAFWKRHELMQIKGGKNPNMKQPLFVLIVHDEIQNSQYSALKLKNTVFNYIMQVEDDAAEIRNICYYYGMNPTGKTKEEIVIALCDYNTGILMRPGLVEKFTTEYNKDNDEVRMKTIVKKAVATAVFEQRNGIFFLNGDAIGNNEDSLVVYCRDNKDIYEKIIVTEVQKRDIFKPYKKEKEVSLETIGKKDVMNDIAEATRYRARAKELGYVVSHNERLENAKKKVEEGEKIHARAKELGIDVSNYKYIQQVETAIMKKEKLAKEAGLLPTT